MHCLSDEFLQLRPRLAEVTLLLEAGLCLLAVLIRLTFVVVRIGDAFRVRAVRSVPQLGGHLMEEAGGGDALCQVLELEVDRALAFLDMLRSSVSGGSVI